MTASGLAALLGAELNRAAPAGARALAAELARRGGGSTALVLYYGSALRAENLEGILDFYVLLDDVAAWPQSAAARLVNRWLPPNVGYLELPHGAQTLRAKFAVMSVAQFAARLDAHSFDTTLWARFCQPALCIWSRSSVDRARAIDLAGAAVTRAAVWAAQLGPPAGSAAEYWRCLFARTYAAELRVEGTARPQDIVGKEPARYAELLPLAWAVAGIPHSRADDGTLTVHLTAQQRAVAAAQWRRRSRHGRRLNAARLLKAAFTFQGAMDYAAWKIERHRGIRIEVSAWQRRHPLLAAPLLYWKLRRLGVLSRSD